VLIQSVTLIKDMELEGMSLKDGREEVSIQSQYNSSCYERLEKLPLALLKAYKFCEFSVEIRSGKFQVLPKSLIYNGQCVPPKISYYLEIHG
jgi:hypothetical protein